MSMHDYRPGADFAREMDAADPLRDFRTQFFIPQTKDGRDCIYLCGNSLGLQPKTVADSIMQELNDWRALGVEGHFHAKNPWLPYHEFLTASYARLMGAKDSEVVAMNTLSVNLHLMMVSFYRPTAQRRKIVIETHAFPSDRYAVCSQIAFHGFDPANDLIELKPRDGEVLLREDDIEAVIREHGDSIAMVMLGGVNYYTGQVFDMARITRVAHDVGAKVGFDLAHAAGNIELRLHDWNVDFACWCSYKYLNSGPGSVAGCFVHERHGNSPELPRFAGWWGNDKAVRFKMGPQFSAIPGAEGWQLSNPPILSLAAVKASLAVFDAAGIDRLRAKSLLLTGYLEYLLDSLDTDAFKVITPRDTKYRGCQLSIVVRDNGRAVFTALEEAGVICDWREPDCIRVAPVPLYNSYQDVYEFVRIFAAQLGLGGRIREAV